MLKRITKLTLTTALTCLFITSSVGFYASAADETGSITIETDSYSVGEEMAIYEVADVIDGEFVLNDIFSDSGVDLNNLTTNEESAQAADALAEIALENAEQYSSATVNSDGLVVFSDVAAQKVYVAIQTSEKETVDIQSILVDVPHYSDDEYSYDVYVTAKVTLVSSVTSDTEESSTPESSTESSTPESSAPESSITESSTPDSSEDSTTVITGDDIAKYFIIGGIVVVALILIVLLIPKKKKGNDDE